MGQRLSCAIMHIYIIWNVCVIVWLDGCVWRAPLSPSVLANVEHISHFCSGVLCQSINHTHLLPSSIVLREICVWVLLDLILSQYIISSTSRQSLDIQSTVALTASALFWNRDPSSVNETKRVSARLSTWILSLLSSSKIDVQLLASLLLLFFF